MKRYSITWKTNDNTHSVEIITSTFTKAINYCEVNIPGFNLDNVISAYSNGDVIVVE